jgi:multidrug transporter EmrE-like cation transporter
MPTASYLQPAGLLAMALALGGLVVYQLAQKALPAGSAPLATYTVIYALAAVICGTAAWLISPASVWAATASAWRSILVLTLSVILIEFGFFWVYRTGWPVSVAPVVVTAMGTALLLPLGWWLHGEKLAASQLVGLVLSLAGLWLIVRK